MAGFNPTFTKEELASEEWKPVVEYEGIYSISTLGRIRSWHPPQIGKIRKAGEARGYFRITLYDKSRKRHAFIHNLVAAAFIGPKPDGYQTNHKDGVKANNRPSNLEYVTPLENGQHASVNGLRPTGNRNGSRTHPESRPRGERISLSKLTVVDIKQIRHLRLQGHTQQAIAVLYGVSQSCIGRIVLRHTWRHVN